MIAHCVAGEGVASAVTFPLRQLYDPMNIPKAPLLVLLPSPPAAPGPGGPADPVILGLSLTRRALLAAKRAGYRQVVLLGREGGAIPGMAAVPDWASLASSNAASYHAPIVIAPMTILAETDWLRRLSQIEPAACGGGSGPGRRGRRRVSARSAAGADEKGGATDLGAVDERLAAVSDRLRNSRPGRPARSSTNPTDVREAERRLLQSWSRIRTASWRVMSSGLIRCRSPVSSLRPRSRPIR